MDRLFGWDLPPGCTSRDIDRAAGALDEEEDTAVPICAAGEGYCTRTDEHGHCADCGSTEHAACPTEEPVAPVTSQAEPFCACGRRWSDCDGSRAKCHRRAQRSTP